MSHLYETPTAFGPPRPEKRGNGRALEHPWLQHGHVAYVGGLELGGLADRPRRSGNFPERPSAWPLFESLQALLHESRPGPATSSADLIPMLQIEGLGP